MSMWHMPPSTWELKEKKASRMRSRRGDQNLTSTQWFVESCGKNQIEIERCSESGIYRYATKIKYGQCQMKARQPGSLVRSANTRASDTQSTVPEN